DLSLPPAGMAVAASSGIVVWTPSLAQVGSNAVVLRVSDGRGGVALQSFQILVKPPNHTPQITSLPTGPAVVSNVWQYQVRAQDADNDPITFSLGASPPSGMTMSSTNGLVRWTPTAADLGTQHVVVVASDGIDSTAQIFDLPVVSGATNHSPTIT